MQRLLWSMAFALAAVNAASAQDDFTVPPEVANAVAHFCVNSEAPLPPGSELKVALNYTPNAELDAELWRRLSDQLQLRQITARRTAEPDAADVTLALRVSPPGYALDVSTVSDSRSYWFETRPWLSPDYRPPPNRLAARADAFHQTAAGALERAYQNARQKLRAQVAPPVDAAGLSGWVWQRQFDAPFRDAMTQRTLRRQVSMAIPTSTGERYVAYVLLQVPQARVDSVQQDYAGRLRRHLFWGAALLVLLSLMLLPVYGVYRRVDYATAGRRRWPLRLAALLSWAGLVAVALLLWV